MNHLNEEQLNEYLDQVMDIGQRTIIERHLVACARCRTRLERLRLVFTALAGLPEQAPSPAFASQVLARQPERHRPSRWILVAAAQIAAAVGLGFFLVPEWDYSWLFPPLPALDLEASVAAVNANLETINQMLRSITSLPFPHLPTLDPALLTVLLLMTAVACFLGNLSLLSRRNREIQR